MNFIVTGGLLLATLLPAAKAYSQDQINNVSAIITEQVSETGVPFKTFEKDNIELDVPYIHQYHDLPENRKKEIQYSACGPTSLTMSFKAHGVDTDLITVIDGLPTDVYVKGVMFYNLPKGADLYDFEATTIANSPKAFYNILHKGYPIILNIQNYMGYIGHAIVITGIKGFDPETGKAEALIAHDPVGGPSREFKYLTNATLKQEEGYTNYIGTLAPFYIKPKLDN